MKSLLKNAARLLTLFVMGMWLAACSSLRPANTPPPAIPAIPALSAELKREPLPSGSYWENVIKWRQTWDETLKTSQPKSEASSKATTP